MNELIMTLFVLVILILFWLVLPMKYDPAIWIRDWRRRNRKEKR
jgi:hypothetical protein